MLTSNQILARLKPETEQERLNRLTAEAIIKAGGPGSGPRKHDNLKYSPGGKYKLDYNSSPEGEASKELEKNSVGKTNWQLDGPDEDQPRWGEYRNSTRDSSATGIRHAFATPDRKDFVYVRKTDTIDNNGNAMYHVSEQHAGKDSSPTKTSFVGRAQETKDHLSRRYGINYEPSTF